MPKPCPGKGGKQPEQRVAMARLAVKGGRLRLPARRLAMKRASAVGTAVSGAYWAATSASATAW